jgi:comEA protein
MLLFSHFVAGCARQKEADRDGISFAQELSGSMKTTTEENMKLCIRTFLLVIVVLVSLNTFVAAQSSEPAKPAASASKVVNINTAGKTELESLPGVGPSLAKKILEFRQKNGGFKAAADIMAVQGIGEKKFEQLKTYITVK